MAKILLWDLELAKMQLEFGTYQLKQYSSYLSHEHIKRPVWIVCAAWKWLDQPYIASTSVLKDGERFNACFYDDYHVVKTLHSLLDEADILVAHNGDNFDWKIFAARCAFHNLTPPRKVQMVDTLKVSRREFRLESHSLRYLARYFKLADKEEAPLWDLIYRGDADEIKRCEQYCRGDIKTLAALYEKIRPFDTRHPNINIINDTPHSCPKCGSAHTIKRGYGYSRGAKRQTYQCKSCHGYSRGKKNLAINTDIR